MNAGLRLQMFGARFAESLRNPASRAVSAIGVNFAPSTFARTVAFTALHAKPFNARSVHLTHCARNAGDAIVALSSISMKTI